jgi:amidase
MQSHSATPLSGIVMPLDVGPPEGPKVAVKDCINIRGLPTGCGSAAYADAMPAVANAAVIDRLLEAGCHIIGKTRMHELAYGMTGVNAHQGTPVNPHWPDRIPGGSSSGSAVAVAAGLVDFAIGTDTGGSIRQPAICCGVIGLKPSFGRIDRHGAVPAQSSLDCIGVFARDMAMIECAMAAIDPDFRPQALRADMDATAIKPPLRLARLRSDCDPDIAASLALMPPATEYMLIDVDLPRLEDAYRAGMILIGAEAAAAFGHLLDTGAALGTDIAARLTRARQLGADDIAWAEATRSAFTAEVDSLLIDCDALLTPALPSVPPLLNEADDPAKVLPLTRYLRPFNLSGHPAIVLPRRTTTGLPSGLQIVAGKGDDARLCALARHFCMSLPAVPPAHQSDRVDPCIP